MPGAGRTLRRATGPAPRPPRGPARLEAAAEATASRGEEAAAGAAAAGSGTQPPEPALPSAPGARRGAWWPGSPGSARSPSRSPGAGFAPSDHGGLSFAYFLGTDRKRVRGEESFPSVVFCREWSWSQRRAPPTPHSRPLAPALGDAACARVQRERAAPLAVRVTGHRARLREGKGPRAHPPTPSRGRGPGSRTPVPRPRAAPDALLARPRGRSSSFPGG